VEGEAVNEVAPAEVEVGVEGVVVGADVVHRNIRLNEEFEVKR